MLAVDPNMTTSSIRLMLRTAIEMIEGADPTSAECELDRIRSVARTLHAELLRREEVTACPV